MTFSNSEAGEAFIATSAARETSPQIMEAIASMSATREDAEYTWDNGIGGWDRESAHAFVCRATRDGTISTDDLVWGAAGTDWVPAGLEWVNQ